MKKLRVIGLLAVLFSLASTAMLSAQEPLTYKKGFFNYGIYSGQKRLTPSEVNNLLKNSPDPETARLWQQSRIFDWAVLGATIGSGVFHGLGIGKNVNDPLGSPGSKDISRGLILDIAAIPLAIFGTIKAKRAIRGYNTFIALKNDPTKPNDAALSQSNEAVAKSQNQTDVTKTGAKEPRYGVQIGVHLNRWRTKEDFDEDTHLRNVPGFGLYFFNEQTIDDKLLMRYEASWQQKAGGLKSTDAFGSTVVTSKTSVPIQYLCFSAAPQYLVQKLPKADIFLSAGAWVAYAMSAKIKAKATNSKAETKTIVTQKLDFKKQDTNRFDFGLQFGVGGRVFKNITAELRYSLGLGDMDADKESSLRNSTIGLTIGYPLK